MLRGSLLVLMMLVASAGCPGGGGGIGDSCDGNGDCDRTLQCLNRRCVLRCDRAPECGDGYACDGDGLCQPATGQAGDSCQSEVDCAAGLSCQLDGAALDTDNRPLSSCTAEISARPAGATCDGDNACRNGTCALGHCIDLCRQTRDCGTGNSCAIIPSELTTNAQFWGCLRSRGTLTWSIPLTSSPTEILLPVPNVARSAALVMTVDDLSQKVGATSVLSPTGTRIYNLPCSPLLQSDPPCDQTRSLDQYFENQVRHQPDLGQSVLAMPSGSMAQLRTGVYRIEVSSFRSNDTPGSAIPHVTAVVQLDAGADLDLHFFFLELDDHPCAAMTNNAALDAGTAQAAPFFQKDYLGELQSVFQGASLTLGSPTYEDLRDHPELDGLDIADLGSLLSLGKYSTGINVFFVRSLSPIGLQAIGPNPGPAGLAGTRQSGIVIGLDTLCYRDWTAMARLTAHEIARYMGLYHNVELETPQHPTWRDPIDDGADSSNNLMFFSERYEPDTGIGIGDKISSGQREILLRSAVLR